MTTITREQQKQILIDTANHVISRDNTSPYSENLRELARIALASLTAEPVLYAAEETLTYANMGEIHLTCLSEPMGDAVIPLYTAPPAPVVPKTLPCSVELKPGLIIGKGCKTETLLTALRRRAEYYAKLEAMTPEEREKHGASIEAFKAMLPQPAPVDKEFIPKNLDKALGVVGVALPESKEEFNFQIERWIQRLIDRVIRYADEFKEQPAPVVPDEMATSDDMNLYQKSFAQGYNACRNAMLNAEPLRAIQTAPALDFLNKNAAPLHATPKGNRLRIAEGEFAAYFPQERPVSGARVIAWDESGHLLGIGFGRDTRGSGIAIVVEGKKYDSNHIIHWCNYPAIPEGLNIRAIAALRAAVRNQWLKSDNFADKVYWKSMHSIANEIVEAMMKNEPHQPTENHIPSREAIIAGGVLVQCPRCYNDSYRLNVNGLTHYWCDKCANSITSESK